jgi:hypothetical protein
VDVSQYLYDALAVPLLVANCVWFMSVSLHEFWVWACSSCLLAPHSLHASFRRLVANSGFSVPNTSTHTPHHTHISSNRLSFYFEMAATTRARTGTLLSSRFGGRGGRARTATKPLLSSPLYTTFSSIFLLIAQQLTLPKATASPASSPPSPKPLRPRNPAPPPQRPTLPSRALPRSPLDASPSRRPPLRPRPRARMLRQ